MWSFLNEGNYQKRSLLHCKNKCLTNSDSLQRCWIGSLAFKKRHRQQSCTSVSVVWSFFPESEPPPPHQFPLASRRRLLSALDNGAIVHWYRNNNSKELHLRPRYRSQAPCVQASARTPQYQNPSWQRPWNSGGNSLCKPGSVDSLQAHLCNGRATDELRTSFSCRGALNCFGHLEGRIVWPDCLLCDVMEVPVPRFDSHGFRCWGRCYLGCGTWSASP